MIASRPPCSASGDAAASGVQSSAISRGIGGTSMAAVAAAAPIASASAASRLSSARGGVVDLPLSGFRRDVLTCFGFMPGACASRDEFGLQVNSARVIASCTADLRSPSEPKAE